jgi:Peptidase A4 family
MRLPLLRWSQYAILVGVTAAGTQLVGAQTPGAPSVPPSRTMGYTIPPGVNTGVYLKVMPNAVCKLREKPPGDVDDYDSDAEGTLGRTETDVSGENPAPAVKYLKLFSDADGNARFFAQPPDTASGDELKFIIRCTSRNGGALYLVRLRASIRATLGLPFPPTIDPALNQRNQTVLPALRDPAAMTDQDIIRAGYPARPDPMLAPAEYARWLNAVSKSIIVVPGQAVTNANVYHGLVSNTWSGDVLEPQQDSYGFAEPYVRIAGQWRVPTNLTGELLRSSAVAEWVGLDGNSSSPLVQAGTDQNVLPAALVPVILGHGPWILSSYNAWTEVFPLQPSQSLPSFPVHPGDTISCGVWISWDNLIPTATGGFAYFQLFNFNTNQVIRSRFEIANLPDFTVKFSFLGHDAEWIVERPSYGPDPGHLTPYDLANYHSQCFNNGGDFRAMLFDSPLAWAETGPDQYDKRLYSGFANDTWSMFAGLTYLSGMYPPDGSSMCFQWFNFH